MYIPIN